MVNIGALVNPSFAWIKKELCLDKIFAPAPGTQWPRTLPFILLTVSNYFETNFTCEKCCLKFSIKEKVRKHQSEMHKVKLSF